MLNVEPELVLVNVRTFASLNEMVAVADLPSSRLTDWPAVDPPKLMGPDALSAIIHRPPEHAIVQSHLPQPPQLSTERRAHAIDKIPTPVGVQLCLFLVHLLQTYMFRLLGSKSHI
jgi:hypothetical protein